MSTLKGVNQIMTLAKLTEAIQRSSRPLAAVEREDEKPGSSQGVCRSLRRLVVVPAPSAPAQL